MEVVLHGSASLIVDSSRDATDAAASCKASEALLATIRALLLFCHTQQTCLFSWRLSRRKLQRTLEMGVLVSKVSNRNTPCLALERGRGARTDSLDGIVHRTPIPQHVTSKPDSKSLCFIYAHLRRGGRTVLPATPCFTEPGSLLPLPGPPRDGVVNGIF